MNYLSHSNMLMEDESLFDCLPFQNPLTNIPSLDTLVPLPYSFDNDPFNDALSVDLSFNHLFNVVSFEHHESLIDDNNAFGNTVFDSSDVNVENFHGIGNNNNVEQEQTIMINRRSVNHGRPKMNEIGLEEMKRYFCMPITRAAKEMNVGVTLLKRRCRELGIQRWPHRKMKSLNTLIHNVQELGKGLDEECIRRELETLQEHRRLMEENPEIELSARTKKLRQACFKANYKRRRAMREQPCFAPLTSSSSSSSTY